MSFYEAIPEYTPRLIIIQPSSNVTCYNFSEPNSTCDGSKEGGTTPNDFCSIFQKILKNTYRLRSTFSPVKFCSKRFRLYDVEMPIYQTKNKIPFMSLKGTEHFLVLSYLGTPKWFWFLREKTNE